VFSLNRLIQVFLFVLFSSSLAYGQATRVWVSGLGDDTYPCSRTAPCRTLAAALTKVNDGGEINALDPGGYDPVTINKSVTIDGGGTLATIATPGLTMGVTINAPAPATVTLRNLSIDGLGTGLMGLSVRSAGKVILDNLRITNQRASNARGIDISIPFPATVEIRNCSVTQNSGYGIASDGGGNNVKLTVQGTRVSHNGSFGITAAYTTLTLIDSSISQNVTGLDVEFSSTAHVHNSSISQNRFGVMVGAPVTLSGCQITGNEIAFLYGGNHNLNSHGNNAIIGNADIGNITPVPIGLQ
jgi:hypothetical protein